MATKETMREIVKEVNKIYQDYKHQLKALGDEQEEVLKEFREKLEEKKIDEIRKSINN